MCKKSAGFCTELKEKPWDSFAPLPKQDWFDVEIDIFVEVLESLEKGNRQNALEQLRTIQSAELQNWMHNHAQNAGVWRAHGESQSKSLLKRPYIPVKTIREVYARDHFHCRYCGVRVFPKELFKKVNALLGSDFQITGGNKERHGIKMCFSATYDHVVPHSRGGSSTSENLVTACWCCNYGKAEYTLTQLGLQTPPTAVPADLSWSQSINRLLSQPWPK